MRKICAVFDSAAEVFSTPPIFAPAVGHAVRAFTDEVRRKADDNPLSKHPQDFVLFELGEYDEATGELTSLDKPRQLIRGVDITIPKEG